MAIAKITTQNSFGDVFNTINTIIDELEEANVVFNDISGNTISLNQLNANNIVGNTASLESLAVNGIVNASFASISNTVVCGDVKTINVNTSSITVRQTLTSSVITTNNISIANKIDVLQVNTAYIDNLISNTETTNLSVNDVSSATANIDYINSITVSSNNASLNYITSNGITTDKISANTLIVNGSDNLNSLIKLALAPGNALGTGANNDLALYPFSTYSKKLAAFTTANDFINEFSLGNVVRQGDLPTFGKLATQNTVSVGDINAGGTANGSTFLSGDGAWKSGIGNMLKSTYDPRNINKDAFNMDNMTAGNTNPLYTNTDRTTLNSLSNKLIGYDSSYLVPSGTIIIHSSMTPPSGYLTCYGGSVQQNTYPQLYQVLGNTFGQANSTHFYLPDLRYAFIYGYDGQFTAGFGLRTQHNSGNTIAQGVADILLSYFIKT